MQIRIWLLGIILISIAKSQKKQKQIFIDTTIDNEEAMLFNNMK
jgi:hypothetical protein